MRRIVLVGVAAFVCGGCGLLFTHGPPTGYEKMQYFSCSENTTTPILDIVWGSLNLLGGLVIAGNPDEYDHPGQATASGFIWAIVSGVSAGVGFDRVKKCRAAKRQLAERHTGVPGVPGTPVGYSAAPSGIQVVVITPQTDTLTIGERVQLAADARDSTGDVYLNRTFVWSSSNDAIASVGNEGLVTAHAEGKVVIAANTANVVGTARIVVVSPH